VKDIVLYYTSVHLVLGPSQAHAQWVPGSLSPRAKRLRPEPDYSRLHRAEYENGGTIPPLPIRLNGVMLI
jgi:hypothetical protein